jgi:hypothetical protein
VPRETGPKIGKVFPMNTIEANVARQASTSRQDDLEEAADRARRAAQVASDLYDNAQELSDLVDEIEGYGGDVDVADSLSNTVNELNRAAYEAKCEAEDFACDVQEQADEAEDNEDEDDEDDDE